MRRREFIAGLGGAAAWPMVARGQQAMIGYLAAESGDLFMDRLRAFLRGLNEVSYVVGKNVSIEFRKAEGHYDQLPALGPRAG
jgi:putative ABC transport system substrate-binding protein